MGYLKSTGTVFIYIGLFLALVAFLPGIPPDAQFSEYSSLAPQSGFTNDPKLNKKLDNAEILFKGEIKGAESFASYNGELYTSLHGGDVVKIVGKHIVPIVKFGKPCEGIWTEKECGRPLGLHFDKKGALYVADPYVGIFKADVTTGKYEKIIDISKPIEGVIPKLANSLDIASNGDIYWSDSSAEFYLQDGVYTCLANPSGRLIKYDAATKRNVVLVNKLGFANGVKLSKDESFVVVAETMVSRLTKFNIKGDKAGKAEIFAQGLPGLPDNIHTDGEDGFLVGLVVTADPEHPIIVHSLSPHPYIRKMLARLLYLLEAPFKLLEDVYPNYYSKRAVHWIGHFESIQPLHIESAGVLRIDSKGKIIDAAFSFDGKIGAISSGYIFKDHIYLGSPYNDYLARVPLSQAFPSIKIKPENIAREKVVEKREVKEPIKPVVQAQPTTTPSPPTTTTTPKPKPVTTTPKPATTTTTTKTTQPPTTTTTAAPPTTTTTTTTTQRPTTAAPKTTQRPPTAAPTTTQPPPPRQQQQQQQQQQKAPQAPKPLKETSTEQVREVPASPTKKETVKEASPPQQGGQKQVPKTNQQTSPQPPSKPAPIEERVKNVEKKEDATKKSEQKPSDAQKPSKPVPVKPLIKTPPEPRN